MKKSDTMKRQDIWKIPGLRDAAKTGWKVDPITGDEVEVIPANPDVPVTPEQPTRTG